MKRKPWWDTRRCRQWSMQGMILHLLGKRIAYVGHNRPGEELEDDGFITLYPDLKEKK